MQHLTEHVRQHVLWSSVLVCWGWPSVSSKDGCQTWNKYFYVATGIRNLQLLVRLHQMNAQIVSGTTIGSVYLWDLKRVSLFFVSSWKMMQEMLFAFIYCRKQDSGAVVSTEAKWLRLNSDASLPETKIQFIESGGDTYPWISPLLLWFLCCHDHSPDFF